MHTYVAQAKSTKSFCCVPMFPSHQNSQPPSGFLLLSTKKTQFHKIWMALNPSNNNNMGKARQPNPCFSLKKDENHAVETSAHRDIEKRRRQEMATLYTSLRNLLPIHYIKGKRAISDHVQEAANYIKDLQKKIKELSVRRDEMKKLSKLRVVGLQEKSLNSFAPTSVEVRSCFIGVEVVINNGFGKQVLHLSRALELLLEEGLDFVSCIATKVNQRVIHTIQFEVSYMTWIDISQLQNKLIEAIPSTVAENSQ